MAIENELLDQLLAGRELGDVFGKDGLFDDLKKALSERILNAELDDHLDGERTEGHANRRNGTSKKSVLTGTSKVTLSVPRDRAGIPVPVVAAPWSSSRPSYPDTPRALPHDRSPGEHAHDDDPHPSPAPGRPRRPVADLTEIRRSPPRRRSNQYPGHQQHRAVRCRSVQSASSRFSVTNLDPGPGRQIPIGSDIQRRAPEPTRFPPLRLVRHLLYGAGPTTA